MNFLFYIGALFAGAALTTQIGLNSQLRFKLGDPILAAFISFFVGTLFLGSIYLFTISNQNIQMPLIEQAKNIHPRLFLGGVIGGMYVLLTVLIAPRIGAANAISLIICGQLLLSLVCDHAGIFVSEVQPLTPLRAFGAALMIIGVYIIQKL